MIGWMDDDTSGRGRKSENKKQVGGRQFLELTNPLKLTPTWRFFLHKTRCTVGVTQTRGMRSVFSGTRCKFSGTR